MGTNGHFGNRLSMLVYQAVGLSLSIKLLVYPAVVGLSSCCNGDKWTKQIILFKLLFKNGKERVSKEIIEAIDKEKKSVTFKVIEGDLMELYKSFKFIVNVDANGNDNLVTWTFEYEKKNENVPDPNTLMDSCLVITKHIENHHLAQPN
ncbi:MLP-like protein [Forsythia ovata]|uniref:MLP-like protein n=1 Tax=Forsythia ovata TaxID=205694 RepID=A0ABD1W8R8_9LAMI